ncbi:MAG: hypothetical protein KAH13_04855 [Tenericutes bacterium]|nr:hypothetical protein [Mycoplasmatota bacterium]
MLLSKQIISSGIAYGKAIILKREDLHECCNNTNENELSKFIKSIAKVTLDIEDKINKSKVQISERVSEIFETHKLIVNDPIVIEKTKDFINNGAKAFSAYDKAIKEVLDQFSKIDNEYMLGRIIDIIDATDRVKAEINNQKYNFVLDIQEPSILILEDIRPSVIYDVKNIYVKGFITEKGYFYQHSGIIARTLKIPGIVYFNIFKKIKSDDFVLLDCLKGEIYINPSSKVISTKMEESNEL